MYSYMLNYMFFVTDYLKHTFLVMLTADENHFLMHDKNN